MPHLFDFANSGLRSRAWDLLKHSIEWQVLTYRIAAKAVKNKEVVSSASVDYLMYAGHVTLASHWLKQEVVATAKLAELAAGGETAQEADFYKAKVRAPLLALPHLHFPPQFIPFSSPLISLSARRVAASHVRHSQSPLAPEAPWLLTHVLGSPPRGHRSRPRSSSSMGSCLARAAWPGECSPPLSPLPKCTKTTSLLTTPAEVGQISQEWRQGHNTQHRSSGPFEALCFGGWGLLLLRTLPGCVLGRERKRFKGPAQKRQRYPPCIEFKRGMPRGGGGGHFDVFGFRAASYELVLMETKLTNQVLSRFELCSATWSNRLPRPSSWASSPFVSHNIHRPSQ